MTLPVTSADLGETSYEGDSVLEKISSPPKNPEVRWMFDSTHLFYEIKAQLMGGNLSRDKDGNYIILGNKKNAMMNDKGIKEILTILRARLSPNSSHTITDVNRIYEQLRLFRGQLALLFYQHMDEFDLTPERASIVIGFICDTIENGMRMSIQGAAMRGVLASETIHEVRQETPRRKILGII